MCDKLKILTEEYKRICVEIASIESANDKIIGFGLTVIIAGFGYGLTQHIFEVFFFVPVATIGVLLYASMQYNRVLWMGGYKRYLEETINNQIGEDLLFWESVVRVREKRNITNLALLSIYFIVFSAMNFICIEKIRDEYNIYVSIGFVIFFVMLCVMLAYSLQYMWGSFDRGYVTANRLAAKSKETVAS